MPRHIGRGVSALSGEPEATTLTGVVASGHGDDQVLPHGTHDDLERSRAFAEVEDPGIRRRIGEGGQGELLLAA